MEWSGLCPQVNIPPWFGPPLLKVAENNLSIVEKKQGCEVTISLLNSGKKRKRVYIFPWIPFFFSTAGSKIIDIFTFQELMFMFGHFCLNPCNY